MNDISAIQRIVESSPPLVVLLLFACWVLWRTLREEMREWRQIADRNSTTNQALTTAIERLRDERPREMPPR